MLQENASDVDVFSTTQGSSLVIILRIRPPRLEVVQVPPTRAPTTRSLASLDRSRLWLPQATGDAEEGEQGTATGGPHRSTPNRPAAPCVSCRRRSLRSERPSRSDFPSFDWCGSMLPWNPKATMRRLHVGARSSLWKDWNQGRRTKGSAGRLYTSIRPTPLGEESIEQHVGCVANPQHGKPEADAANRG